VGAGGWEQSLTSREKSAEAMVVSEGYREVSPYSIHTRHDEARRGNPLAHRKIIPQSSPNPRIQKNNFIESHI